MTNYPYNTEYPEPFQLFKEWFFEAKEKLNRDHTTFTLATSTKNAIPSARILLLKKFDERGFCFFTNLTSCKGRELKENPNAAMCFYWEETGKQIRIEGNIEKVSDKEADDYFASRDRGSQLGAWASNQSSSMNKDNDLADRLKKITEEFTGDVVPRPPHWSGFRLIPKKIEFWKAGEYRLHTRIIYSDLKENKWKIKRFYP
jgi:pyridoxamine 5'-phosphate oxidase